ncbi:anaerobic ribonucleoside-triphosphate reductase activating protein [Eubacterium oxidoreducens]|uniref:Anaerobic ribonucleoside-triphosphate reductase-activating protein n=1 Tax=Eubacterium oxidoreducens TaxID=1732 RepID=A0A1G6AVC3_EUBOX|nr:anaerobic ribonucleoside-triphosphate reductase activating protein [Eubacterium oxidoreducens]SDB12367.1 anaerobic ribonucleoside-triphosphate reductase activating protein [Eubacterium oxidoreducens]
MKELYMHLAGIVAHSMVDGPGVRMSIFFQGCIHACDGCHNPDTWDVEGGEYVSVQSVIDKMRKTRYLDGITLSGGDPFVQAQAALAIAQAAKEMGLSVWVYTGWTLEELLAGKAGDAAIEALNYVDVLVDGRFVLGLKSSECIYRGSTNQRLIDIVESLRSGKSVEIREERECYEY